MQHIEADQRQRVSVVVNGRERIGYAQPRLLLSDFLRHELGLTGTHVGCEHGVCGACTVLVDGKAARSCLMLAVQVDGARVDTVESLASGDTLNGLQRAFRKHHALQCGYCTPGILMSATELLGRVRRPTEEEVRDMLAGHLCRCTGYAPIVRAVLEAAGTSDSQEAKS
jgi:2-furoyl-CoA dehydrogenase 2Fe-2S iron sulfur subunit